MTLSRLFYFLTILAITLSCSSCTEKKVENDYNIIPYPNGLTPQQGSFTLSNQTYISTQIEDQSIKKMIDNYSSQLRNTTELEIPIKQETGNQSITFILNKELTEEAYELTATPQQVTVKASAPAGFFYGIQSLEQMLVSDTKGWILPCVEIKDSPRFAYRGMHLDVSRHFFSKEFVKKQIDAMSRYKLNRLHWHLTDGAGWRIEIKKYPKLTELAAYRPFPTWKEWWKGGRTYCTKDTPGAQGGYYTQDDIREVVAYAKERNITIIPEIEMPGHSEEVLAVYPELSCSGKAYIDSDFCIGNEKTFTFLQDVLTEVMDLFPSEYIHVGGDEAGKGAWKKCPKCQKRMQNEKLKDVDELQSYLIKRMEKFLNANGRKLLGWDEILEGGLAPEATVMSWRGEGGGIAAAKSGHDVVMTPGEYCYFDGFQDAPQSQPEAISGYLTLQKVYSYNPTPTSLTEAEAKYILGVQANLWTEYISTPEHAEYMIYPRLLALSEVAWTQPENKLWDNFRPRVVNETVWLKTNGYNPFDISEEKGEKEESFAPIAHQAVNAKVTYNTAYHPKYKANGDSTLVDGIRGGWSYGDRKWQGFLDTDMVVVIDLGDVTEIHSIAAEFMQQVGPYVWLPSEVVISISSNGNSFTELQRIPNHISTTKEELIFHTFGWEGKATARYIKYYAKSNGIVGGWLFTDEIVVK